MKLIFLFLIALPAIAFARGGSSREVMPHSVEETMPRKIPESVFTVIAPGAIRPGKPYNIYIRGFDIKESVQLIVRIKGTSDTGVPLSIKKYADLSRDNSKVSIRIDTSSIPKGTYILTVDGDNFSEKRTLLYNEKKYTFLLQLNKPIFLPNDLIQFRIYSIDSETKTVTPVGLNTLTISDPKDNVIKTFENVAFKNGKYEGTFQLSNKAATGAWTVTFLCDKERVMKRFDVEEYQLPLISAKLTIPPTTPFSYGKVPVTVDISYTSGGSASGTANLKIAKDSIEVLRKSVKINSGSATFDLDIVKDLKAEPKVYSRFEADVTFEDALTGNKVTDNKAFTVASKSYHIQATSDASFFKPGTPFTFKITMKKFDGTPAPAGTVVIVDTKETPNIPRQTLTLGSDGTVSSSVNVPPETTILKLGFTSEDSDEAWIYRRVLSDDRNVRAQFDSEILTNPSVLNQPVKIKFTVREDVEFIMVHAIAKGVLLDSAKLTFGDESNEENEAKTAIYTFTPSFKYAPSTNILGYYIKKNGDFEIKRLTLSFREVLPNYLKINPKANEVKPGENLEIDIESYVDSVVSLAAIDQRVLLLKKDSLFQKNVIMQNLNRYDSRRITYDWGSIASYERIFGGAGLYFLTNIPRPVIKLNRPGVSRPMARERPFSRASRPRSAAPRSAISKPRAAKGSGPDNNDVKVREDFRETFLWRDVKIKNYLHKDGSNEDEYYNGLESISEKVPESITTYLIYGVSMSKYDGIGLTDINPTVAVFLPFFLAVEFPYSVKRNEVLVQDIFVFNYLKKSQTVEVKIKKDSKYEAVDLDKYEWTDCDGFYVKTITTTVGQNVKLQFALRPKILGFTPFEITAKGPIAGDGLKKQLRVIPEGVARSITKSVFIAIEEPSDKVEALLKCNLPDSAYQDTTEISATIVGDIFGKALSNLDKLIQMPSGCGEQTMLGLAPDIAIYAYLSAANKLTPALKTTLENYILAGYQNELKYQRNDGSFSAFGNNDPSGSTWLTGYVGLFFSFAKKMVTIDSNVIKRAAEFVVKQQNTDGSFKEPGRVIHSDMQGGSGKGIGLTAYCTIFLTSILDDYPDYTKVRDKAVGYLKDNLNKVTSTYELGIITYALQLAKSSSAKTAFDKFNAKKTEDTTYIYWAMPAPPNPGFWYGNNPRSLDVEVTSYGLLTYVQQKKDLAHVLKVVKYIVSKSNSLGGYSSSQDTVMAIYALSQFARTFSLNSRVDLTLAPNVGPKISAKVDSTNAMSVQSFNLNPGARKLNVKASSTSSGLAIVSLVCDFYEDPTKVVPTFNVAYEYKTKCTHRITFEVCASYIPPGKSNMAIMTVTLPSGFVYSYGDNGKNPDISQVEVVNQGSSVTFYFNTITNKKSCVTVNAYRSKFVDELKDGVITVTDYYDTSLEGMTSLSVPDLSKPCFYGIR